MEEIVLGIGITALAGALATVAGAAEDTESDIGSQGDPNSQVDWLRRWVIFTASLTRQYPVSHQHMEPGVSSEQELPGH